MGMFFVQQLLLFLSCLFMLLLRFHHILWNSYRSARLFMGPEVSGCSGQKNLNAELQKLLPQLNSFCITQGGVAPGNV
jgi:hypothetical protein